jgi:DNA-binding SARP family transcriptional activator/DNA-binding CsgD family transcriptional regulator
MIRCAQTFRPTPTVPHPASQSRPQAHFPLSERRDPGSRRVLDLRLLGEIELIRDGERIALPPSRKTRALLAYLAATGRPHRRDRLCAMFWDVPDDPRGALRWSLSRLRGLVDEPGRPRIVATHETVAFEPADAGVDLLALRAQVAAGLPALSVGEMQSLAEAFRGEFLEGLDLPNLPDFQSWCLAEREDLRRLHVRLLSTLIGELADRPEAALPHAREFVRIDPFNEAARASLLQILVRLGRQTEADQQFDSAIRALKELGDGAETGLARMWRKLRAPGPSAREDPYGAAAAIPDMAATRPHTNGSDPARRRTLGIDFPARRRSAAVHRADTVSDLIGDIYDASLDPSLWPGALLKVRAFVGGSSATLFAKDAIHKSLNVYYEDGGLDPHYKQLYFEKYAPLDPFTTGHLLADVGEPQSTMDILPYSEFYETRFYREWALPQGLVDFTSAVIEKSATSAAMFGVFRHERDGYVDDETKQLMRLVVPHIRRAALIGRVIEHKSMEAATFADTLDGLSAGIFLVDETDRLIHANESGQSMLEARDVLHLTNGRLGARDPRPGIALHEVFDAAGSGDAAVGTRGISIPLTAQDGDRYVAHVLPLTSGARRRAGSRYAAVAATFVHRAALETQSPPEALAKQFGLTPSELRVLLAIVQIGGVAETAEALGISEATVKTHLHRLFGKTDTARQAELVKLVAGYTSPLAG